MIEQLFANKVLLVAMVSWFVAQLIKIVINLFNERTLDLHLLFSSGGMPSSHSAFTMALAIGVGQTQGYQTALFAIAMGFSFVVMYDAANVRLEAGKQAALLNKLTEIIQHPSLNIDETLKELLGHTPLQVGAGALLGIIIALALI